MSDYSNEILPYLFPKQTRNRNINGNHDNHRDQGHGEEPMHGMPEAILEFVATLIHHVGLVVVKGDVEDVGNGDAPNPYGDNTGFEYSAVARVIEPALEGMGLENGYKSGTEDREFMNIRVF